MACLENLTKASSHSVTREGSMFSKGPRTPKQGPVKIAEIYKKYHRDNYKNINIGD